MERIGLLEDMRREREQQGMLTALIADAPPTPIAMDEVSVDSLLCMDKNFMLLNLYSPRLLWDLPPELFQLFKGALKRKSTRTNVYG